MPPSNAHRGQPWLCGFNYVTGTAVNSTEMWTRETWDVPTIKREFDWAARIGLNACRVFLPFIVWDADPGGLADRFERFLDIADTHGLSVMPILFDDCAFAGRQPYLGPQDAPVPGVHNSGWTPSPGHGRVQDRAQWPRLAEYVKSLLSRFARDERIVVWDLYNEAGNGGMGARSLPLLRETFAWARETAPEAPLTSCVWETKDTAMAPLNEAVLELSDVVSFHHYGPLAELRDQVAEFERRATGRPLFCTEWMARTLESHFATHLPFFHEQGIGCWFWGLVRGRTQTWLPWEWSAEKGEPEVWFHDLLQPDGHPYRNDEVALIERLTKRYTRCQK